MRQLDLDLLPDDDARRRALEADPQPTLLLAADAAQASLAHAIARPLDDVSQRGEPPEHLAARLARLQARHALLEQMTATAATDALTGLPTRRNLEARATALLARLPPTETWALLIVEVHGFADWLARHDAASGDEVLRQVGAVLAQCTLPADLLGRLDEARFAVIARRPSRERLHELGEVLRLEIDALAFRTPDGVGDSVTARVGLAPLQPGITLAQALHDAHQALLTPRTGAARAAGLVTLLGRGLLQSARRHASTDRVTQAWNHDYFVRRLGREMEMSRKDGRPLTLALVELDHLGRFTGTHGTAAGDAVLRRFADLVTGAIRPMDWLSRYDGASFALVLPGTVDEARHAAERIRALLAACEIDTPQGATVQLTLSIGLAGFAPATMTGTGDLVQRASSALHAAHRAGRNCVISEA